MGDAENSDQEATDYNPEPPTPAPIITSENNPVLNQTDTTQNSAQEIAESKKFTEGTRTVEWLQFGVNTILALVGIAAIFIYLGQLQVMKQTLEEIARQFPEIQKQSIAAQGQLTQAKIDSSAANAANAEQINAMQKQLQIAKQQLAFSDRPWIKVEVSPVPATVTDRILAIGGPLRLDEEGHGMFTVNLTVKNIGHTTAIHVYSRIKFVAFGTKLFLTKSVMELSRIEQKKICDKTLPYYNSKPLVDPRSTIFPDDSKNFYISGNFDTNGIGEWPSVINVPQGHEGEKRVLPFIVGCIDYQYATSSTPHQTGFIYKIKDHTAHGHINLGDTIPIEDLTFENFDFGGNYAY
jgi:hypothetical protein